MKRARLAILASGTGTNAEKIIDRFPGQVLLVASNKPEAGVLAIAERAGIPTLIIDRDRFRKGDAYVPVLQALEIDWVILAGFLWKIPVPLIRAFPNRIVNIHPALLPKYGGKGMYGPYVHEAVLAAGESESGITIHYVDEQYDHGKIILQERIGISPGETPDSLAKKIQALEHKHYPLVIARLIAQ